MRTRLFVLMIVAIAGLSACTWVKLSPSGEKVRILERSAISTCKKIGKTNVSVADKVIGLQRNDKAIQENLNVLARNAAAGMGGDTIVPEKPQHAGKQTFDVYRCNGI